MSYVVSSPSLWMSFVDPTGCLAPSLVVVRPPPDLTVSQWADSSRMLSPEASAEPGQWLTSRAEYQRGIMDAVADPSVRQVVAMTSAQVGKSEILLNIIGFHIDQDPAPILMMQPTVEMAEAFSKDRLAPMLRDTPCLRGKVSDPRSRDSGNTVLHKRYPGGHATLVGSNSPSSIASRPIRVVLCDEVSRYPVSAGTEGDPVSLAIKRTATFWNRVVVLTSTPTYKLDRIHTAYEQSDQRRYEVACPHCGQDQRLEWARVSWPAEKPQEAVYACAGCGSAWTEADRLSAIQRGAWRATAPFTGVAGFHLSELYSPWRSIADIARDYEAAKANPEMLRAWTNTSLGLPYEEAGEQVDAHPLMARAHVYAAEVPAGACVLTAGIDVQQDRIELEVVAWGPGHESWSVDYRILPGLTAQPEVWDDLGDALRQTYRHESGVTLPIAAAGLDTGYLPQRGYEFCLKFGSATVWPIKGVEGARPIVENVLQRARRISVKKDRKVRPQLVGVDEAKSVLYRRLAKVLQPGPGYCHVPAGRDEEWFLQLTAEQLVTGIVNGRPVRQWKRLRPRNEALDCRIYAMAALHLLAPDLDKRLARIGEQKASEPAAPARPGPRRPRPSFKPRSW